MINIATQKITSEDPPLRDVKSAMSQTDKLKKRNNLNASGYFVFNEEDMKNMTEMSPKNRTQQVCYRSLTKNFDPRSSFREPVITNR